MLSHSHHSKKKDLCKLTLAQRKLGRIYKQCNCTCSFNVGATRIGDDVKRFGHDTREVSFSELYVRRK